MAVLFWVSTGCAVHDQVQYFAATDPETGATNYYRMTISGWGALGTDYHLQAGYFSSEAVDVLRGSMPEVPILDMPIEQLELYDRTAQQFYASVLQEAKRINPIKDPSSLPAKTEQAQADTPLGALPEGIDVEPFKDDKALEMSRQIWLSSLSKTDLASMGRTQNTNPYQFRKLVFWVSANNIDLNHFAAEIDGVIDNVTAIASTFKGQADQRKAQQESKRKCCEGILNSIPLENETQRGLLEALFELVLPGSSGAHQSETDGAEP